MRKRIMNQKQMEKGITDQFEDDLFTMIDDPDFFRRIVRPSYKMEDELWVIWERAVKNVARRFNLKM